MCRAAYRALSLDAQYSCAALVCVVTNVAAEHIVDVAATGQHVDVVHPEVHSQLKLRRWRKQHQRHQHRHHWRLSQ